MKLEVSNGLRMYDGSTDQSLESLFGLIMLQHVKNEQALSTSNYAVVEKSNKKKIQTASASI